MDFPKCAADLEVFMKLAKSEWTGVEAWAALGLCWGGKLVAVKSGPDTPFKVSAQVHPGLALSSSDVCL